MASSNRHLKAADLLLWLVILQAQQALLSVQWPEGLGMDEPALPSAASISARRPSSEFAANLNDSV
jgi:hypothetical protein